MQVRQVSFYSEGSRIAGDFYLPDDLGASERRPALLLCNGYTALKKIILPDYARVFVEAGYPTLAFDYRGFGESEGAKWRIVPNEQLDDIRNAITWLEAQPEVDPDRIGIWGTSNGGALVISAAARDPRVACVVGQLGYGDGARLLMDNYSPEEKEAFLRKLREDRRKRVLTGRGDSAPPGVILNSPETSAANAAAIEQMPEIYCEISWESAEATLDYRPIEEVHRIAPRPILLIAAEYDASCAPDAYRAVFDRAGEPKRWLTFPAQHYDLYLPEWVERAGAAAVEWFDQHL